MGAPPDGRGIDRRQGVRPPCEGDLLTPEQTREATARIAWALARGRKGAFVPRRRPGEFR